MNIGTEVWFITNILLVVTSIIAMQFIPELLGFFIGMLLFAFLGLPIILLIIEKKLKECKK